MPFGYCLLVLSIQVVAWLMKRLCVSRVTLRLPSCSGSDGIPYRSIPEWLESIRMKRYISNFRTAGLDTMESILELTAE